MSGEVEGAGGVKYLCLRCGATMTYEQITSSPEVKCMNCGYRVLRKARPPIVKAVKAR
ncbi:MAG: RNA polymerase Rbp10 [Candidatus Bathyarchaeia archaeon]